MTTNEILLSDTARQIADLAGFDALIALSRALGGLELTFAGKWKTEIIAAVGIDAQEKLAEYYGPELITIPINHRLLQLQHKEAATLSYLNRQSTGNEAALMARVTARTIRNWAADKRAMLASGQTDLFAD